MNFNLTKNDLEQMEAEVRKQLSFAKTVHANTKELEKQLDLVLLAKVGIAAMLD